MNVSAQEFEEASPDNLPDGWEWAIVEVFGHRRHAGRAREEERFGAKLLRIDIPIKGDPAANGWQTMYYGGGSIFSFSLCDEQTALALNRPYEPPSRLKYASATDEMVDHEDDEPTF